MTFIKDGRGMWARHEGRVVSNRKRGLGRNVDPVEEVLKGVGSRGDPLEGVRVVEGPGRDSKE